MTEETLRRVIREECRSVIREELAPIKAQLDGLEQEVRSGFSRVTEALTFLASCWPGSMPGHKSHVARKIEEILSV